MTDKGSLTGVMFGPDGTYLAATGRAADAAVVWEGQLRLAES